MGKMEEDEEERGEAADSQPSAAPVFNTTASVDSLSSLASRTSPLTLPQALLGSPNLNRLGRGKLAEKRATEGRPNCVWAYQGNPGHRGFTGFERENCASKLAGGHNTRSAGKGCCYHLDFSIIQQSNNKMVSDDPAPRCWMEPFLSHANMDPSLFQKGDLCTDSA
jgi:hypothetical protein